MLKSDLAANLQATALATLLESAHTPHELTVYHGALTPRELDAPEVETEALAFGAALHDLGWMRRVDVRGADRFRWLSGMVTNTVNDLFPNTGAWNLVLNAQGHIQGDLTVWRSGEEFSAQRRSPVNAAKDGNGGGNHGEDKLLGTPFAGESGLELELAADQMDKLLAHLNKFIVMDDVELVSLGEEQVGEAGSETAIGLILTLTRGLNRYCAAMACWRRTTSSGCRRQDWPSCGRVCARAEQRRWVRRRWRRFALPRGFRRTGSTWWSATCRRRRRRCGRCTSARAATWARRLWSASGRGATCTGICGTELTLEDGTVAGTITSAAELSLKNGARVFALGMMRAEAEAKSQSFRLKAGAMEGTASILAAPPRLKGRG